MKLSPLFSLFLRETYIVWEAGVITVESGHGRPSWSLVLGPPPPIAPGMQVRECGSPTCSTGRLRIQSPGFVISV